MVDSFIKQDAVTEGNIIEIVKQLRADVERLQKSAWSGAEINRLSRLNVGADGAQAAQGDAVVDGDVTAVGGIGVGGARSIGKLHVQNDGPVALVVEDSGGADYAGIRIRLGSNDIWFVQGSPGELAIYLNYLEGGAQYIGGFYSGGLDLFNTNFTTDGGNFISNEGIFRSGSHTIDDDSVYSFSPTSSALNGIIAIRTSGGALGVTAALAVYRVGTAAMNLIAQDGSNFERTTGALTGTTGTNGKITLSADGTKLYIENRGGGTITFAWTLLG